MQKLRLKSQPKVEIQNTGIWKLDGNSGKTMCLLIMEHEQLTVALVSVPTHDFCEEYVDKMLESEYRNDHFVFLNGRYGKNSKRPPQLLMKIEKLQKILDKWKIKS